jgi:hypothetical protein
MICQQWTEVISSISSLFSVTVSEQYTLVQRYFCMTLTLNMDLLENVG